MYKKHQKQLPILYVPKTATPPTPLSYKPPPSDRENSPDSGVAVLPPIYKELFLFLKGGGESLLLRASPPIGGSP